MDMISNLRNIKIITLVLFCLLFFSFSGLSQRTSNEKANLNAFVKENISIVLNKIPQNKEHQFGFNNREEFDVATIGDALQLIHYGDTLNGENYIWRVPIIVNGEYRALLTIYQDSSSFKIADFGAAVLAKDIQQKINQNPNLFVSGILRIHSISGDFLIVKSDKTEIYIPLTSAIHYISSKGIEVKSYYNLADIKKLIKT